ncbi:TPA: tail fiber assembly protein [Yersinia enterocolitica]|uniref:tail fiber assembly protein n=1 Tax=Yersinia enterocolitica TaxID=630 RepID=UPI0005DC8CE3|nr:tail fiber assembly protein [Yersinia enterocolitica]EKN5122545.1 phage tail protein [Yersinia enterocolitica]ELI7979527.1 tail fiber assembly protein [Yersinia enterocolitica]ELI9226490.1 tail fiber assembly protein [Yersinia enterocolitica]ELW7370116.1 tail fiber assembly protein [Yersinia enterocolitica]ELY5234534.1 tail fiber assembly protein [Yersinia enterocolitica]
MRTYSELGTNVEYISYSDTFQLPEKCIVMNGPRPDPTYYADENGEWLPGPAPRVLQQMIIEVTQKQTVILSHASDMIGAIADEIEELVDSEKDVSDKLRADLKAWKQYRVAVKNVDVSLAPNIEWPTAPE